MRFVQRRYIDEPLDADDRSGDKVADRFIDFANHRLAALVEEIGLPGSGDLPGAGDWAAILKELDDRGEALAETERRALAVRRASVWADVRRFVSQDVDEVQARATLRRAIDGLAAVARGALDAAGPGM